MELKLYSEIVQNIHNFKGLTKDCLTVLKDKYPNLHPGTLSSILSHEYQKKIKRNNRKIAPANLYNKYIELKNQSPGKNVLISLATDWGLSPILAARLILKHCYNASRKNITAMLKDTTLIENKDLAYEVFMCSLYDDQYSPIADTIKHTIGQQYEIRLYRHLENLGVAFKDEECLRELGYDATPDIKLEVPIWANGFVINWIESKALFGDEEAHKSYMQDQYARFGPGLVIYWFGFLETIIDPTENRIIIMDAVLENITCLKHSKSECLH